MKHPVTDIDKLPLKIIFPKIIAIYIAVDIVLSVVATYENAIARMGMIGLTHFFTVLTIATVVYFFVYEFASVTIDDQGITVTNGKLVLKRFSWKQVKRIEKVQAGRRGTVLLILTNKKESRAFRRGCFIGLSISINYIAMDFSNKAERQLRKYLPINICNK